MVTRETMRVVTVVPVNRTTLSYGILTIPEFLKMYKVKMSDLRGLWMVYDWGQGGFTHIHIQEIRDGKIKVGKIMIMKLTSGGIRAIECTAYKYKSKYFINANDSWKKGLGLYR